MWNCMSEDDRSPYKALADADVVRYQEVCCVLLF
ncbi:hypothetical protein EON65_21705 [archaeon]|nr:MAG: hypothetical protein EON65_21705 [archaeon]